MGKRLWHLLLLTCLAGVASVLLNTEAAVADVPEGFDDKLVSAVRGPTAIAFTPDGRMLVTTQPGVMRLRQPGSGSTSKTLDLSRKICSGGERGMLGVAVDPNFESNKYVYVYYTHKKYPKCLRGRPESKRNPVNRVSRFVMSGDNVRKSSEKVLIDNIPTPMGNHNGGDIHFGKDGYLYVSVGDGGRDYKNDSGGAGENDAARDRNVLLGKILRVTRNGGIPSTNPYTGKNSARCGTPSANGRTGKRNCQETYSLGLRNPFRMAFDPDAAGTKFFINDVGQNRWEEINRGKKGADYAWNLCEGRHDNPDRPGSVNCGSKPYTPPIHEYNHNTGCSSITGAAFVPDGVWPEAYKKSYLYGDYVCGKIFKLTPKSGGGYSETDFLTGLGRGGPVAMTFGPNGKTLYYTTYTGGDGGQIRAISYTRGNRTPDARAEIVDGGPNYGPQDKEYQFTAEGSSDPDGNQLTYEWKFGDGATATGRTASHTYPAGGKKTVTLTVSDGNGGTDSTTLEVFAGNTGPPEPEIQSPAENLAYEVGQKITLRGSAADADDGELADDGLTWEVKRHHNNDHDHPYFTPQNPGNDLRFTAPPPEDLFATDPEENYLEVRLTATDSQGLKKTVSRNIRPKTVNVRFVTRPTDLKLVVNGQRIRGPKTLRSWPGYELNVQAAEQRRDGKTYAFESWSDGEAARHTITTPPEYKKYVARFERR